MYVHNSMCITAIGSLFMNTFVAYQNAFIICECVIDYLNNCTTTCDPQDEWVSLPSATTREVHKMLESVY